MAWSWKGDGTNADLWKRMVVTGSRRRRWEVPLWIVVIAASMFLMGFLVGNAQGAVDPCAKQYPAVPVVHLRWHDVPLHPVMLPYARCVKGQQ